MMIFKPIDHIFFFDVLEMLSLLLLFSPPWMFLLLYLFSLFICRTDCRSRRARRMIPFIVKCLHICLFPDVNVHTGRIAYSIP